MLETVRNISKIPELRKKILITLGFLVIYRVGFHLPLPGLNMDVLEALRKEGFGGVFAGLVGVFNLFSGGNLSNCALFSLGIMPYISSSIIFQLLIKVIPRLEEIQKEGPSGQRKIAQWTRYLTIPICLIQAYMVLGGLIMDFQFQGQFLVPPEHQREFLFLGILALTTGTVFIMWIGEQITEYGIGNGASVIIMCGIIARLPSSILQLFQPGAEGGLQKLVALVAIFVCMVGFIVFIQRGQRRIPMQQAKHTRGRRIYGGQRSYLPLKVNAAGVMPVIFASSLLIFPNGLATASGISWLQDLFAFNGYWYSVFYVLLIFFFTYFWTSLMYQPVEIANNMKEYGSFVPGIRPGRRTAEYLDKIMIRITLVGGAFLAFIAIFPQIVGTQLGAPRIAVGFLGGTSILIIVGVALDVVEKIESHLLMRHYDGFLGPRGARVRGRRG